MKNIEAIPLFNYIRYICPYNTYLATDIMKRVTSILLLLVVTSILVSAKDKKSKDKVIDDYFLLIKYEESVVTDTLAERIVKDVLSLEIGRHCAAFYSEDLYFIDSLKRTENGTAKLRNLQTQYAREGRISDLTCNTSEYIYMNYPDGEITVRTQIITYHFEFSETIETPKWELSDSTKIVCGYTCHKAVADFRGRKWIAWYAPELPFSYGPWKLCGLPGLILESYDNKMEYKYTATEISEDSGNIVLYHMSDKKYNKTNRIDYLRALAGQAFIMNEMAKDIDFSAFATDRRFDYRETDYHR